MQPGDARDPLLLQVLPSAQESDDTPGYAFDPLSESDFNPQPGVLHKYQGRVLVLAAPHCAVHCRYCFRRHFPYQDKVPGRQVWEQSLQWLAGQPQISEVIYSGGDPLAASDKHLAWLTDRISEIPHIGRLRIHTRTPVLVPARVDEHLIAWLKGSRLQKVMVIHCNHANEIDTDVIEAMSRLRDAGVTLLNQSVLLKGVNDSTVALADLSEALFAAGVLPYYLHALDKVHGVAHFDVDEALAKALITELKQRLPGYLVPRLVREIPGEPSKTGLS
jgi:EF-P beta-lysylation protein EpmB